MQKLRTKLAIFLAGGLLAISTPLWSQEKADSAVWNDVLNDRSQAVMKQLAAGLSPNEVSEEGQPLVMWAIQNESWAVYDLFTQHRDFDPNITNANNETPLMYLAILGELQRGQELHAQGAKINRLGWTPLHYAASKGQVDFARWLLDEGAFIHAPAPDGTTPLMMGAFSGNREMVDLLLDAGADLRAVNIHQHTAVDWAESANERRMARYLQDLIAGKAAAAQAPEATTESAPDETSAPSSGHSSSKYFDLDRFE